MARRPAACECARAGGAPGPRLRPHGADVSGARRASRINAVAPGVGALESGVLGRSDVWWRRGQRASASLLRAVRWRTRGSRTTVRGGPRGWRGPTGLRVGGAGLAAAPGREAARGVRRRGQRRGAAGGAAGPGGAAGLERGRATRGPPEHGRWAGAAARGEVTGRL